MINSYDLEKYNINQWISQRTVGFINQRNICYMNSVLQILSNIKHISTFFLTN
jgi:ubiquitin C-terminal hydrolase